ncbi:hypothetical protein THAOC_28116, partial [Thalassiosira oceanica]
MAGRVRCGPEEAVDPSTTTHLGAVTALSGPRLRLARRRPSEAGKSARSMSPSPLGCPEGPPASGEPPASSTPVGQVGEVRSFSNIPPTDDGPNGTDRGRLPSRGSRGQGVGGQPADTSWLETKRARRIDSARVNVNPPFVLPLHRRWSFAKLDPSERLRMQRRRPVALARYESILAGREGSIRGQESGRRLRLTAPPFQSRLEQGWAKTSAKGTLLTINVSRPPWSSYLPIVDDVNSPSSAKLRPTHSREKLGYGGRPNPRSNCSLHPSRPSRSTRVVAMFSAPIKASTTRLGDSPPLTRKPSIIVVDDGDDNDDMIGPHPGHFPPGFPPYYERVFKGPSPQNNSKQPKMLGYPDSIVEDTE